MKWTERGETFGRQQAWLSECGLFMVVATTYRNQKRALWRRDSRDDGAMWRHVGDYARGDINSVVAAQTEED